MSSNNTGNASESKIVIYPEELVEREPSAAVESPRRSKDARLLGDVIAAVLIVVVVGGIIIFRLFGLGGIASPQGNATLRYWSELRAAQGQLSIVREITVA